MLARSDFRKSSNYYLAAGTELLRPFFRVGAGLLANGVATEPARWRRGILLGATHIGDVLYRTSSLAALKVGLPDCAWYFLAESGSTAVIETNPDLAGVITGEIPKVGSSAFFTLARELRAQRFDVAICYGTGTYWPELFLSVCAGIPNRVGYVHRGFSGLVTRAVSLKAPQPFPGYFRDLVAELIGRKGDWPLRPVIVTDEADQRKADALWDELAFAPEFPVLACFVTTRQPTGVWPRGSFAEVLCLLAERHRLQIVLCGAPDDAAILAELKAHHRLDCQIAAGRLGLRALVAFLRRCTAVLSTDSGPRHLANAAGAPVFFVRNLWFNKIEAGSYCESEFDFAPEVDLSNPAEMDAAFRAVTPQCVADAIAAQLKLPPR